MHDELGAGLGDDGLPAAIPQPDLDLGVIPFQTLTTSEVAVRLILSGRLSLSGHRCLPWSAALRVSQDHRTTEMHRTP